MAKKDIKKSASTDDYIEEINDLLGSLLGQIHYDYPSVADGFNKDIDSIREILFDMKDALTYTDAGLLESTKKSKMEKSSSVESMMDELLDLAYDYDSQWVDTIMDAQYEYSYGGYHDVKADINEILQNSNVGKIIGLCEDILDEMDRMTRNTKKSKVKKWVNGDPKEFIGNQLDGINATMAVANGDYEDGDFSHLAFVIDSLAGYSANIIEACRMIEGDGLNGYDDWLKNNKSTKKSVPKTNMSFEDNVNKMRQANYARTGNINTVMKKRD